ncbi:MAG: tyrosine-type recombinase/integrase [Eggerthellaceae bacterium]|jgi:integrase
MAELNYTTRSMRRRRGTDMWEVTLSHKNPLTGEVERTYHTVEGKTQRQAERKRDELILDLERKGGALATGMTVREFMAAFLDYKEASGTIEPSTVRSYRGESKLILRYIGTERLTSVTIGTVNDWMAAMTKDGYAPKTCAKVFRLLKQAMKWGLAQDLITKNPCDFCKPPKRVKTPINALNREDRTRMMRLAAAAQPAPLGMAIELALTTGMRRGEVCALRWSDLGDDGTITVSHALGNAGGGFYEKEPKTQSSARTIPLTRHTFQALKRMRAESRQRMAEFGLSGDPYILGTQEPESRPYNPTQLGKDFAAFCKMNGFKCTFHDLRHTFATMMIAAGTDVRTVASYLGHASVSMTLNIYADVDPDAKKAAVSKVDDCFDVDMTSPMDELFGEPERPAAPALTFTVSQLEAMLAQARANGGDAA